MECHSVSFSRMRKKEITINRSRIECHQVSLPKERKKELTIHGTTLRFENKSFPKLQYIKDEFLNLARDVRLHLPYITQHVVECYVKKAFRKRGYFTENEIKNFKYLPDTIDILVDDGRGEVYVQTLGFPNDEITTYISPTVKPLSTSHSDFSPDRISRFDALPLSDKFKMPTSTIVWLGSETFNEDKVFTFLDQLNDATKKRLIFLTNSDIDIVSKKLQKYSESFQKNNILQIDAILIRQMVSDSLTSLIFKALEILKFVIKGASKSINNEGERYHQSILFISKIISSSSSKENDIHNLSSDTELKLKGLGIQETLPDIDYEKIVKSVNLECQEIADCLDYALSNLESLLLENPKLVPIKPRQIPQKVKETIEKLYPNGVIGYCLVQGTFFVFVQDSLKSSLQCIELIKQRLSKEVQEIELSLSLRFVGQDFIKLLHNPGERIVPNITEREKYGTLGGFVVSNDGNFYGITSGHVVPVKGNKVYLESDGDLIEFGECYRTTSAAGQHVSDISLITVLDSQKHNCLLPFRNDKYELSSAILFRGQSNDIGNRRVFKLGASTKFTRGQVIAAEAVIKQKEFIFVKGFGKTFAEGGDSGSIVFMYDPKDRENKTIIIVSMVEGVYEQEDGDLKNAVLTCRVDEGLEKLETILGVTLNFPCVNI